MSGEPTLHRVQLGDETESSKKKLMFADGTAGGSRKSDSEHESQRHSRTSRSRLSMTPFRTSYMMRGRGSRAKKTMRDIVGAVRLPAVGPRARWTL